MNRSRSPLVGHDADWLVVSAGGRTDRIPAIWLRDNVPSGRHRADGQRTFDITELESSIAITAARYEAGAIEVTFSDGVVDRFDPGWLLAERDPIDTRQRWDHTLEARLVEHRWADVRDAPSARLAWCRDLRDLGVALLRGTPAETGTVVAVTELFGFVRETNYGRTFDVRVEDAPNNLAFTSGEIGPHTDNPYRDPAPGIQLLHCLMHDSVGGLTRLTDGLAAAEELRERFPEAWTMLIEHPVSFEFVDRPDAHLRTRRPLIETDADGRVVGIRFNSRSAAAFDLSPELLPAFYDAYRRLADTYRDPRFRIEIQLEPGDVIAFDNRRILHGRSAFEGPRTPGRLLCRPRFPRVDDPPPRTRPRRSALTLRAAPWGQSPIHRGTSVGTVPHPQGHVGGDSPRRGGGD